MTKRKCPRCGRTYTEHPAISRSDSKTEICPDCGIVEAMEAYLKGAFFSPPNPSDEDE